ncbi:UNVERIFIED_CONTAM: hypothetical protein FKN15_027076 [Acipenser sinensis]
MSLLILLSVFLSAASVMYLVYRNFPELNSLQTFAIPGSIFLSILSGYLYPFPLALFLVCLCSGLGASFCYMLSYLVGRPVVYKYLTEKAVKWSQQVDKHRGHLINYIVFLRITPFLPNWFINITSPVINVPLGVFFIGTFFGKILHVNCMVSLGESPHCSLSLTSCTSFKPQHHLVAKLCMRKLPLIDQPCDLVVNAAT